MNDLISRQAAIEAIMRSEAELSSTSMMAGLEIAFYKIKDLPTIGGEWLHEYLQTAVDFCIITETQASRLMDMIDTSEDNT